MSNPTNTEYMGIPSIKVELIKTSQQYIAPIGEFDYSIDDFYQENSIPGIENDNIYFLKELGVAMVQPIWANRNNFVQNSSLPDETRYEVEVPVGAPEETEEEKNRRVFIPIPTLHQAFGLNNKADFKYSNQKWEKDWDYNGPIWNEFYHSSKGQGVKKPSTWIHQGSSSSNVEWLLIQKGNNYTNQHFWIDVHKHSKVDLDAEDTEGAVNYSRYHMYGGKRVEAYFGIRIGWEGKDDTNVGIANKPESYSDYGPYDIIFPIDDTPFIWDHNSKEKFVPSEEVDIDKGGNYFYNGSIVGQQQNESWILKDDTKYFRLYFHFINGKLVIRSSNSETLWIFPQDIYQYNNTEDQERYSKFFIPAGKIAILGRGFKFRFSYNPLEFNVYNDKGTLRNPSAFLRSKPIQERTEYPNGEKGGYFDLYQWKIGSYERSESMFMAIPQSEFTDNMYGFAESMSYGFDAIMESYPVIGGSQCSYTSMMIGIDGSDPSSFASPGSVVRTKLRSPTVSDSVSKETRIQCWGFDQYINRDALDVVYETKFLETELNCKPPVKGKYTDDTSLRFASPIVFRWKGKHLSADPTPIEKLDISQFVTNVSYDSSATSFDEVRQEFTIEVLIPKKYNFGNGTGLYNNNTIQNRSDLIEWLAKGVKDVKISLGWIGREENSIDPAILSPPTTSIGRIFRKPKNGMIQVFNGLAVAGPLQATYSHDTISLSCKDKIQLLEDYPILNSPFYDGCNLSDAFLHICQLGGLPESLFDVQSRSAHREVLGVGYDIENPAVKFDSGTTIMDAVRKIAKMFWHVLRTNPDGTIVLTDLNLTGHNPDVEDRHLNLEELDPTHVSYIFYVDGSKAPNPYQRIYNSISVDRDFTKRYSNIEIFSIDRGSASEPQAFVSENTSWDIDAVENPDSPDFLGYRKPMRIADPSFGSRKKIRKQKNALANHVYEPPLKITFSTYGRPTIRPFDIIKVVFSDNDDMAEYYTYIDKQKSRSANLRVMSVSGSASLSENDMHFTTEITAERI